MNKKNKTPGRQYSFLLVDGYNLAHAIPEIARYIESDLGWARELLLIKLSSHAVRHHKHITVVFDGQNLGFTDHGGQPGIRVIFSAGAKADRKVKEIADRLAKDNKKREWLVVTSDFDICYHAQGLGLKTESSRDFASRLKADESKIDKKSRAKQNKYDACSREKELSPKDREWIYSVFMEKKK